MKKLMIIALALIFMVPALAVYAGEVEIGGSYRVTWTKYDPGWGGFDVDTSEGPDDIDYFQQRIRIPITWKANDNVSFYLRTDWSEEGWGNGANLTSVDYAYATIAHDAYWLRLGLQTRAFGHSMMWNPTETGAALDLFFGDITLGLDYFKVTENGSTTDTSTHPTLGDTNDTDLYAINVVYKTDAFQVGGMIAQQDNNDTLFADRDVVTGFGAFVKIPIGNMAIGAELNVFDGDNGGSGAAKIDYKGTQFLFDLGMPITETVAIGFTAVYAKGTDDADEAQVTSVNAGDGGFASPMDFGGALAYDEVFGFGHMFTGGTFEPAANSGVLGAAVRVSAKVAPVVTIHARFAWLTAEEDGVNGAAADLDDVMVLNASVDYAWQPNVTVSLGAWYADADFNDDAAIYTEEKTAVVARLGINF
ncbi:MAG: hypothetical protein KAJ62_01240 [Desulfobacteraceae bacterium]|nr:hypothetical protein [Desulfobacteraceae bacterium]